MHSTQAHLEQQHGRAPQAGSLLGGPLLSFILLTAGAQLCLWPRRSTCSCGRLLRASWRCKALPRRRPNRLWAAGRLRLLLCCWLRRLLCIVDALLLPAIT